MTKTQRKKEREEKKAAKVAATEVATAAADVFANERQSLQDQISQATDREVSLITKLGQNGNLLHRATHIIDYDIRVRTTLIDSLMQERLDLLSRAVRIDQRLEALGMLPDNPVLTLFGKKNDD